MFSALVGFLSRPFGIMTNKMLLFIFATLLLSSCFKEDKPVQLAKDPESRVMSVFLGLNYENQLFFSLEELAYKQQDLNDWDLAFDNFSNQFKIVTNYGRDIFVAHTQIQNNSDLKDFDPRQHEWLYDFPSGNIDSNAFGDWTAKYGNTSPYFVIDMGRLLPLAERYFFVKIEEATTEKYVVKTGNLSAFENEIEIEINRNPLRNFSYLNVRTASLLPDFEPESGDWDIVFTRYRHIFYIDPNPTMPFPYLVTGALLNPRNVSVAVDTLKGFENIDLAFCQNASYTTQQDVIGYAWKEFDFTVTFTYSINPRTTYIVNNTKGEYFKIRFLDFYNENREKGYPKFEIKKVVF